MTDWPAKRSCSAGRTSTSRHCATLSLEHFAGQTVSPSQINDFTVVETPYSSSHWNRRVLKPLEKEGRVSGSPPDGRGRQGYPMGTTITFPRG